MVSGTNLLTGNIQDVSLQSQAEARPHRSHRSHFGFHSEFNGKSRGHGIKDTQEQKRGNQLRSQCIIEAKNDGGR